MADNEQTPNPALRALDVLEGTWDVSGPTVRGRVTYAWLEGGYYLTQQFELDREGHVTQGIEYIGHDPSNDTLHSYVFSNEGGGGFGTVALEYVYEVTDETLTIWGGHVGSPAAYRGRFNGDRTVVAGAWEWPGGGYESTMTRT